MFDFFFVTPSFSRSFSRGFKQGRGEKTMRRYAVCTVCDLCASRGVKKMKTKVYLFPWFFKCVECDGGAALFFLMLLFPSSLLRSREYSSSKIEHTPPFPQPLLPPCSHPSPPSSTSGLFLSLYVLTRSWRDPARCCCRRRPSTAVPPCPCTCLGRAWRC